MWGVSFVLKKSSVVDFKFVDKNLLDCSVHYGDMKFFVSCVYGHPNHKFRHLVWERLSRIGIGRKES